MLEADTAELYNCCNPKNAFEHELVDMKGGIKRKI